jgi:hypothetical protein
MKLYKYPIFHLNLSLDWRFLTPLRSIRNDNSIVMMREAETILARELSLLPISRLNKACHSGRQRGTRQNASSPKVISRNIIINY